MTRHLRNLPPAGANSIRSAGPIAVGNAAAGQPAPGGYRHTAISLLDVAHENELLMPELLAACQRVLQSGQLILGSEVAALEADIAGLSATKYAIGCASGSDALLLALMALNLQPGDEVILPSFTFFATASAVWRLGARPVFADIDPQSFCITADTIAPCITSRTRAVIPVHLFGQAASMDGIMELARSHGLLVIEDVAQAIGSAWHDQPVGSWGDVGCLSFYPTKNLGGFGDGGMLVTRSFELADRLQLLRGHGMRPRYYHAEVGINSRLDEMQAALLRVKLPYLKRQTEQRQENAQRYDELFSSLGLDSLVALPQTAAATSHVWNQYTLRILDGTRDALREYLRSREIGTEIYYPLPLHQQQCFAELAYESGSLPQTEMASRQVLSLPIHPWLSEDDLVRVVSEVAQFFGAASHRAAG